MHPAHTLPAGDLSLAVGATNRFALGPPSGAIEGAQKASSGAASPEQRNQALEGGLAHSLSAPGLAPWLAARFGIVESTELGLGLSGRSGRLDARYSWQNERRALSAGLGLTGILGARHSDELAGIEHDVRGFGVDMPLIAGWRSDADVIRAWGGPRVGFESLRGNLVLQIDPESDLERRATLDGWRWYAGGLIGIAAGVAPVWVAVELEIDYQALRGATRLTGEAEHEVALGGVTMTPAVAMLFRF